MPPQATPAEEPAKSLKCIKQRVMPMFQLVICMRSISAIEYGYQTSFAKVSFPIKVEAASTLSQVSKQRVQEGCK
jgi:hypothetical protein